MRKKRNKIPALIGIAVLEAYRFYKGKGVFNGLRYAEQHRAAADYIEAHYPGAFYSAVTKTEGGWSCCINNHGRKILLYMTKTDDGMYVFWEKEI